MHTWIQLIHANTRDSVLQEFELTYFAVFGHLLLAYSVQDPSSLSATGRTITLGMNEVTVGTIFKLAINTPTL